MNKFKIFETQMFLSKLSSLSYNDEIKLKMRLQRDIYPQLRQEPKDGKNTKKLPDEQRELWRYKLGIFRIFYAISTELNTIYILTLDVGYE